MTNLLPNVRMERKVDTLSCRCSYQLSEAFESEAESWGVSVSSLIHDILTDYITGKGKQCLSGPHPLERGVRELHHLTIDILLDGEVSPLERQRWTQKATKLLSDLWNEEHQEEVAS